MLSKVSSLMALCHLQIDKKGGEGNALLLLSKKLKDPSQLGVALRWWCVIGSQIRPTFGGHVVCPGPVSP